MDILATYGYPCNYHAISLSVGKLQKVSIPRRGTGYLNSPVATVASPNGCARIILAWPTTTRLLLGSYRLMGLSFTKPSRFSRYPALSSLP